MKRSWKWFARACPDEKSVASVASAERPFAVGSGPMAFRNAGEAFDTLPLKFIANILSNAGNRGATKQRNSGANCRHKASPAALIHFATGFRNNMAAGESVKKQPTPRSAQPRTSPRKVTWQILKQPEEAQSFLEDLYRRSPEIAVPASTAREFFRIIGERDVAAWPEWQRTATTDSLAGFAKHLCHDQAAFLAALEQPWSNGPVEGQVHRLKLIKRSMYGRASFDLLRLRVLSAA